VIKYPWRRTGKHESASKWNAYQTEASIFDQARAGMDEDARSPEAAIMDWADDITYAVHDLEDFVRAGRVPILSLAMEPDEFKDEFGEFTSRAIERLKDKEKFAGIDWDEVLANFKIMVQTLYAQFQRHSGTADDLARLRSSSRVLINSYVSAISLQTGPEPLLVPPRTRGEVELFKQLTWHYVIHDPALATLQEGHVEVVNNLFNDLFTWLGRAEVDKSMFRLPQRLLDLYGLTASEPGRDAYNGPEPRQARAVADYIASLTETQAIDLHERLRGTGRHSVSDPWLRY